MWLIWKYFWLKDWWFQNVQVQNPKESNLLFQKPKKGIPNWATPPKKHHWGEFWPDFPSSVRRFSNAWGLLLGDFLSNPLLKKMTWKGMIFFILKSTILPWFLFIFCSEVLTWKSHQVVTVGIQLRWLTSTWLDAFVASLVFQELTEPGNLLKKTTNDPFHPMSRKLKYVNLGEFEDKSRFILIIIYSYLFIVSYLCFFSQTISTGRLGRLGIHHQQIFHGFYNCWGTKSVDNQWKTVFVHLVPLNKCVLKSTSFRCLSGILL